MEAGLAVDGGLFVPETFPKFQIKDFDGCVSLAQVATRLLTPFFEGDRLAPQLRDICESAFDFPVPLKSLARKTAVLELFHGPTAAFKDVGARFLAECLSRLKAPEQMILVATSGDTGGAVAAAFHRKPGVRVVILFPKDGVSDRQRRQLTCWGDNIEAFAVLGTFDDCQRLVKSALADESLRVPLNLRAANSINIGRLLPQMAYYATASLEYFREHGVEPAFAVPSGNVGNASAALWAKRVGLPIRRVALATNANAAVPNYFAGGEWAPQASISTLANAMDVGNPSNMERVFDLYANDRAQLSRDALSLSVTDDEIRQCIREGESRWNSIWCPHTATAVRLREQQSSDEWILVATAHPAKFESIVEPLIGRPVPVPPALAAILNKPGSSEELPTDFSTFRGRLSHKITS